MDRYENPIIDPDIGQVQQPGLTTDGFQLNGFNSFGNGIFLNGLSIGQGLAFDPDHSRLVFEEALVAFAEHYAI